MRITIEGLLNVFFYTVLAGLTLIISMHYFVPWAADILRAWLA